jgi:hypothetical protein
LAVAAVAAAAVAAVAPKKVRGRRAREPTVDLSFWHGGRGSRQVVVAGAAGSGCTSASGLIIRRKTANGTDATEAVGRGREAARSCTG